jgi:beta-lactam-binding protein with PASTA domain
LRATSFVVPSVIGDTTKRTMLTLMKAGIRMVEFKATGAGTGPAGVVVAQSTTAGTTVAPGTGGTLTVKS